MQVALALGFLARKQTALVRVVADAHALGVGTNGGIGGSVVVGDGEAGVIQRLVAQALAGVAVAREAIIALLVDGIAALVESHLAGLFTGRSTDAPVSQTQSQFLQLFVQCSSVSTLRRHRRDFLKRIPQENCKRPLPPALCAMSRAALME